MRYAVATLILALPLALQASQVFHMDMEDAAGMADCVLLARVEHVVDRLAGSLKEVEYTLDVLAVAHGPDSLQCGLRGVYVMDLPRSYTSEDGSEVWESPLVTGSGMEMSVEPGDTVVALTALPRGADRSVSVVRMESVDSLESVVAVLARIRGGVETAPDSY